MERLTTCFFGVVGFLSWVFGYPPRNYPPIDENNRKTVVLLGDSLIYITVEGFGLINLIRDRSQYARNMNFINAGVNGDCISGIRKRLRRMLGPIRHSEVLFIMFWDSDFCNLNDHCASSRPSLLSAYRRDVSFVVESILAEGHALALCSPGLLPDPRQDRVIEEFSSINRELASTLSVKFVDVRTPLHELHLSGLSPTVDGEHLNQVGAAVVAGLFATCINDWVAES